MAKILDQPRYKCALSAMQTVQSIPGAIPVLHSGPGCASKLNDNRGTSGHYSANIFPCTSVSEKEVVFGGAAKLRATVESALKVIDADLFVILSGCTQEIIGDDIREIAAEFEDAEKPVVWAKTPGFKGNNYLGHDWILKALFEQLLKEPFIDTGAPKQKGLVNLFVSIPQQDPFWLGNLREIEKLLTAIGLTPNTIFGFGRGIENIKKIPQAEFTILVSPWVGIESAKYLEKKFKIPLLHYKYLPIGAFETSKFLRAVQEFTGADKALTEKFISEQEKEYYYYIERFSDTFLESRAMGKRFSTVSDAHYALSVTKFLVNDLGEFPETQYITDDTPAKYRDAIREEFENLNYGIKAPVEWNVDGLDIDEKISKADYAGTPLILGSMWEEKLCKKLEAHFINISYPMNTRLVINSTVAGYAGGLKLIEDIYTEALAKCAIK